MKAWTFSKPFPDAGIGACVRRRPR
jgi:hypothetical protein